MHVLPERVECSGHELMHCPLYKKYPPEQVAHVSKLLQESQFKEHEIESIKMSLTAQELS